ncbi:tRNA 2-thiouridine(34) synthase MnmA [Ehrlichia ruminantium]|uniref:tRNA-specific 2-thiouridylase MnmA n=1 Tax=Ehrlichia ruminantium (strain Welgevonden) TaxID=254945 RepID=MNMA_EHRRW|nr:tRNA 2-thiouridine(34) synthase MnmA [Ehrlichia ruminantium]Q5HBV2.1 RecName: Full=tRNA-specific 2-thiouridylase MnmA [Ehrlichia ruminantium str. Welgevonden]QLK54898.1 tRNA 2-thiouridine(34) synthase MnmA [Ehrlichia ruminantium]QLK55815.1 tRNA 2-thiouridine(34) synthase MnmA [Ehrlichia ruminantium]UOD99919.1 tRNA 2-thiouridine(34) synthase MnmA [Ehrlichia ruminantium]CAH57941.1 tRNA (5-methylaminomethyl-2-thiouridylate)-methyltransferase [Ehrlichia ruminantium str. Welgevonden]CAI26719.1 
MLDDFKIDLLVKNKPPTSTTAVVAMSGGVDSSVAAALLHKLGYKVIGITLQLYNNNNNSNTKGACCGSLDTQDAKQVASSMGFPHYTLNYEKVFREEVIEDFIDTYTQGKTPIPCIKCNQVIKFRDLLNATKSLGADVLVTGHYIRKIEQDDDIYVYSSKDTKKDQSYFLFATTVEQLRLLRFPLGNFHKEDIRKLAKYFNLQVANKPDSQNICFVTDTYKKTIAELRPHTIKKGNIIDINGNILSQHNGIVNFTIGQRKGIGISSKAPLYVIKLNPDTNEVTVGPKSALLQNKLYIREINWLAKEKIPHNGLNVKVKLRSSHSGSPATIFPNNNNTATILLQDSYCTVTPGQACVIYDHDRMLGGGWIC